MGFVVAGMFLPYFSGINRAGEPSGSVSIVSGLPISSLLLFSGTTILTAIALLAQAVGSKLPRPFRILAGLLPVVAVAIALTFLIFNIEPTDDVIEEISIRGGYWHRDLGFWAIALGCLALILFSLTFLTSMTSRTSADYRKAHPVTGGYVGHEGAGYPQDMPTSGYPVRAPEHAYPAVISAETSSMPSPTPQSWHGTFVAPNSASTPTTNQAGSSIPLANAGESSWPTTSTTS